MTNNGYTPICSGCRRPVAADFEGTRLPCPYCGSTARTFDITISESVQTFDHISVVHRRDDEDIGFSESTRIAGEAAHATLADGRLVQSATGPGSQNEQDSEPTCQRLVRTLNRLDPAAQWSAPVPGKGRVDWTSAGRTAEERLDMQVVRAVTDRDFWRPLNLQQKSEIDSEIEGAAERLWAAVCVKKKIQEEERPALTLVLDANRTPGQAFSGVVEAFRSEYGIEAQALGFKGIYVVGPTDELVHRLDCVLSVPRPDAAGPADQPSFPAAPTA